LSGAAKAGSGWTVLRFWETEILRRPDHVAERIIAALG